MDDSPGFFTNPNFMPHGHCYLWQPDILWTHVLSDILIAMAYYAIPVILAIFLIKRRQSFPFPEILALFVAFIFLCGTTHLLRIYVTWYPAYQIEGWLKAVTAFISVVTAIVLVPRLPQLISLPGIQEAYKQSQEALEKANEEKSEMQAIFNTAMDRESKILALKEEVNALLIAQNQPEKYQANKG